MKKIKTFLSDAASLLIACVVTAIAVALSGLVLKGLWIMFKLGWDAL